MQVKSSDESRHVADDIDLFRMQSSYDEEDQSQHVTAATIAQSVDSRNCLVNYEYRSRDEVANAILKLRGKEKQAEFINKANPHPRKVLLHTQRDFQTAEVTREPVVVNDIVPLSYSSRTWAAPQQQQHTSNSLQKTLSATKSFVSMSVASRALTAEDARSSVVPEQLLCNNPLKVTSSATRSIISMGTKSRAAEIEEAGVRVLPDGAQTKSLQNELNNNLANSKMKKKEKPDGILRSLFRCGGLCATETQLSDYPAMEALKEYSVEGVSNDVKGLKIETSSQFLSPPPPSRYIHVAPCEVVQHSASIGGCSTITYSVAGKIVARDETEKVPDNAATMKHSNLSTCASSLMDRDNEVNEKHDDHEAVQVASNEQMSNADYESLGLGSKGSLSKNHYKSKSASMSYMSVVGKGSSMSESTVTELDTQTKSQSFSLMSYDDGNTFSSASDSSDSEEDSDYTLTDASCSIDDTYTYASTLHDDSMTYETSLSGSSCASF